MEHLLSILVADFLGQSAGLWLAFIALIIALLVFDLGVLNREDQEIGIRESLVLSGPYISVGLAFGGWVWWYLGAQRGMEYFTGFMIEKTLAMDNVFLIAMIFSFFAIPLKYQHRVLFWGILGVIGLRAIMIGAGAALALLLIFIGGKIMAVELVGKMPASISLSITLGLLLSGILYSIYRTRSAVAPVPTAG